MEALSESGKYGPSQAKPLLRLGWPGTAAALTPSLLILSRKGISFARKPGRGKRANKSGPGQESLRGGVSAGGGGLHVFSGSRSPSPGALDRSSPRPHPRSGP